MDQIKIGKFIASCRKEKNLTQAQLAEKLGITDRAVSKWETGKSMPDSSIMLELCELLSISVNELLKGEKIAMENYGQAAEEMLLEMRRREEDRNKLMLQMEVLVASVCTLISFVIFFVAALAPMGRTPQIVLVVTGIVLLIVAILFALKMEQDAGFYVCKHCNHSYQPSYMAIFWALHMGRTRYMKCPKCGKRSYQKKHISYKEDLSD